MKNATVAIGIDLGGTTFAVGALDCDGKLLACNSYDTPASDQASDICDAIADAIRATVRAAGARLSQVAGFGIGIPGRADPPAGAIVVCPNLHALDGVRIVAELKRRIPSIRRGFVANDAEAAALAELRYGAAREVENLLLLTLGTGIGGGIAMDNRVIRGPRYIIGEVSHMVLDPSSKRRCGCGNFGCFETLAGKQAIIDMALHGLQEGRCSLIAELAGNDPSKVTPELIAEAARAGDELALEVYGRAGNWIGIAICSMIVLCDPDLVVLGGGIAAAGDILFEPVRRTVAQRSRISGFDPANIVPAELGNDAGVYGAAALVWEHT